MSAVNPSAGGKKQLGNSRADCSHSQPHRSEDALQPHGTLLLPSLSDRRLCAGAGSSARICPGTLTGPLPPPRLLHRSRESRTATGWPQHRHVAEQLGLGWPAPLSRHPPSTTCSKQSRFPQPSGTSTRSFPFASCPSPALSPHKTCHRASRGTRTCFPPADFAGTPAGTFRICLPLKWE